ncbi:MarR family winged helix-turn-helix transcriptional regulator [Methylobacterium sp. A54F]
MTTVGANEPCHCTLLRKAARRVSAIYDRELAGSGLRITQYALLAEIGRSAPISITDLAAVMVMERNGLGHNLRLLERQGFVLLAAGRDRRSRAVSLTEFGRQQLAEIRPHWQRAQRLVEATGLMDAIRQPLTSLVQHDVPAA